MATVMNAIGVVRKGTRFAAAAGRSALAAARRDDTYEGPPLFERVEWIVCARDLSEALPAPRTSPGFEMVLVSSPDDPLLDLLPEPRRPVAARALARGDFAFFALDQEGPLAAHIWVATEGHHDSVTGLRIHLESWECWAYDARVEEEYRGSSVARAVVVATMRECERRGYPGFYAAADRRNRPSLALFRIFGLTYVQSAWSITMLDRIGVQYKATSRRRPATRSSLPRRLGELAPITEGEQLHDIVRSNRDAPSYRRFAGRRESRPS